MTKNKEDPPVREAKWYVLRTKPQHEKKIAEYLKKLKVEHYLPLVSKKREWSDRVKYIDFPLFPGYLFVCFHWLTQFAMVIRHPGGIDCIRNEKQPASMTPMEIENLKLLVEQAKEIYSDPDKNFPPGQEVVVRHGPLKGVQGIVARIKNRERIYVRLPLLNRMISTELDVVDIEKT